MPQLMDAPFLTVAAIARDFVPKEYPPEPSRAPSPKIRLEVLDAVRGLAALCVVFFHIREAVQPITLTLTRPYKFLAYLAYHGHDAVVVFIVLSGFVLTIPIARSSKLELRGGFNDYIKRRARRILPPYYAALFIFILLGVLWHLTVSTRAGHGIRSSHNPFIGTGATAGGLLSHVVLIHNFVRSWDLSIDSPMWSVATEFQIYFLFPLVLLPVWRRAGLLMTVIVGFTIGMIPVMLLPRGTNYGTSSPWLLGDFALGMAAAAVAFSSSGKRLPKGAAVWALGFCSIVAAIAFVQVRFPQEWPLIGDWFKDMATGLAIAFLLVYLARCQTMISVKRPIVFRMLDSRAAIMLGTFSYSLYLVHLPLLLALNHFLSRLPLSGPQHILLLYVLGTAQSLAAGYGFYLVFERPFCRPRAQSQTAPAAVTLNARSFIAAT